MFGLMGVARMSGAAAAAVPIWPPVDAAFPTSKLVAAYIFTDAEATTVPDLIGSADIDLTLPTTPNATITSYGVALAAGLIQTPSLASIRAQTILYKTNNTGGTAGFLISGGSTSGLGATQILLNTTESYKVAGFGVNPFNPRRRSDTGSGAYALNRGGWTMLHREMAATYTSAFGLGGRHSTTTSRCDTFEINCAFFWNAVLTTDELAAVHRQVRIIGKSAGVYIHRDDVPAKNDLYVILGESNADGRALISTLSAGDQATDTTRTLIAAADGLATTAMIPAAEFDLGVNQKVNSGAHPVATKFGPEFGVAFTRSTATGAANKAIILKSALGSTYLVSSAVGGVSSAATWSPDELATSGCFSAALRQTQYAMQALLQSGVGFRDTMTIGLWLGINDALSLTYASSAAEYQGYLQAFLDAIEGQFPDMTVNLVCFRPHGSDPASNATALSNIRTAYADFDTANANVTVIDTDALGLLGDSVHYDAAANKTMGATLHDAGDL